MGCVCVVGGGGGRTYATHALAARAPYHRPAPLSPGPAWTGQQAAAAKIYWVMRAAFVQPFDFEHVPATVFVKPIALIWRPGVLVRPRMDTDGGTGTGTSRSHAFPIALVAAVHERRLLATDPIKVTVSSLSVASAYRVGVAK